MSVIALLMALAWYTYYLTPYTQNTNMLIQDVMAYRMDHVLERCKKDHGYTDEDMVILEQELKRFLLVCITKEPGISIGMYSKDVDNLWHSFILFTKKYAAFCKRFNKSFIHHNPKTSEDSQESDGNSFLAFSKAYEALFKEPLHDIWYLDYCEKHMA